MGRMDNDVDPTAPDPVAGTPKSPTGLRALVVEDETNLAGVLGSYLERDGFETTLIHDGLRRSSLPATWTPT